ncbi:SDR family oxidoreductase [Mesorhizobium sp.]|uniref:SDR family NAD(P)-dependent oxidoreductase n=1 Tax=Mesorhizobium sp. TaxID=1871066 RepID=UPI000FE52C99|nr:SDR family oxidoreductase [Mesorhizobium sp.]RWE79569.1 MAG: SDR family oxidoreductase [Mesorhizobium sp.]
MANQTSSPVVLITGALTGIGRATALAYAQEKATLVVTGRRDEVGKKLAEELHALGAKAEYVHADVSKEADVRNLIDETIRLFGRLDIAVNNAGTEGTPGPILNQTVDTYAQTFNNNVLSTFLCVQNELRVMKEQGAGSIVNVTSAYGKVGGAGAALYVASKHAVEGLTKSAAMEAAEFGVRVNAVAPGPTDTGMFDRFAGSEEVKDFVKSLTVLKRSARPEEIAASILFVGSDKASYVTGQSFSVDGGATTG